MVERFCAYGAKAGCKECPHIVYARCPIYSKYHLRRLVGALAPFRFQWDKTFKPYKTSSVMYVAGNVTPQAIGKLKSAAINWAIETNQVIVRLDTNRILDRIIEKNVPEPFSSKGYLLDLDRVKNGKDDETKSCIRSFVATVEDLGGVVFMIDRYLIKDQHWTQIQ